MAQQQATVLIVDCSIPDIKNHRRYLQADSETKYIILEGVSVYSALSLCQKQHIDLILLELELPDCNGLEFLIQIKALFPRNCPPCIILTKNDDTDLVVQAIKGGAEDYLIKGRISPQELRLKVRSAIRKLQNQQLNCDIKNLEQLEAKLQGAKEQLRLAAAAVNCIFYDWDYQNNIVERICGLTEVTGYTLEEAGTNLQWWYELIHPEDRIYLASDEIRATLATNDRFVHEYRIQHQNGSYVWLQDSTFVIRDRDGKPKRIFGCARDITSRKNTEAALGQSEETVRRQLAELEAIYTTAPIGLCYQDTNLRYIRMNERLAQINGLSVEEHLGKTPRDIIPEVAPYVEPLFKQVIELGEPILNLEISTATPALPNVIRDWLTSYYPLKDKNGQVLGVNVIVQEITERKQAETALRRSEQKLTFILDNVNVAISRFWVFANRDWKYDYYSSGCEAVFGYTCEELVADKNLWVSRVVPEDLETIILPKFEDIFAERTISYEYRFRHKNGEIRWVSTTLTSQRDGTEAAWIVTSLDSDITESKRLQQDRELLLVQAQAARREAEVANRTKDEFLAVVSHELRSPLNSILGWAKLLKAKKLDAANIDRALETIERNAKAQSQLIEDLLDISRMIHGNMSLNLAPVNLATVIEMAINVVSPSAQVKQIQIQPQLDADVDLILGDVNRLQQILVNLLTNAIKFTHNCGKIGIQLSMLNNFAQIQVTDTGKGISAEFLPYIFERFSQVENTTTRAKDGLGLGLAIVRHLVELHNGTVSATSKGIGLGATFTILLPCLDGE